MLKVPTIIIHYHESNAYYTLPFAMEYMRVYSVNL